MWNRAPLVLGFLALLVTVDSQTQAPVSNNQLYTIILSSINQLKTSQDDISNLLTTLLSYLQKPQCQQFVLDKLSSMERSISLLQKEIVRRAGEDSKACQKAVENKVDTLEATIKNQSRLQIESCSRQGNTLQKSCPENFLQFNDSCYVFVNTQLTWLAARQRCNSLLADLVSIETADESEFLKSLVHQTLQSQSKYLVADVWTSGSDREHEGQWTWESTGKKIIKGKSYTNWQNGNPGRILSGDCLALKRANFPKWSANLCLGQANYICEMKL